MRSIKVDFNKSNKGEVSSYIAFTRAIKGKGYSYQTINNNFNKFVEKSDYDKKDRKALIQNLCRISRPLEGYKKEAKNRF